MSMISTGRAAIYGTSGTLSYTGVASANLSQITESVNSSGSAVIEELRDGDNELIGQGWSDKRETITISFTPIAAAASNTIANAHRASALPQCPGVVTLSSFKESATNTINGTWIYDAPESASVRFTAKGKAVMSLTLWRPKTDTSARVTALAGELLAETQDFQTQILLNSGTISSNSATYVDNFIRSCMDGGIWSKILDCGVFVGSNLTAAMAKLKAFNGTAATLTNYNFVAGDYNESGTTGGLLGNGSTKYLGTGVTPAMLGATAHMSFYLREDLDVGYPRWCMGATSAADEFRLGSSGSTSLVVIQSLYGSNQPAVSAPGAGRAFWCGVRGASTDLRLYRNGALAFTNTTTVTPGACSREIILFGSNGPTAVYPTLNKRGSFYSLGLALTTTEAGLLYAAVQDLQSSLARTAEVII